MNRTSPPSALNYLSNELLQLRQMRTFFPSANILCPIRVGFPQAPHTIMTLEI